MWQAAMSEDATLAKFGALANSSSAAGLATNAWNLGIDGFNSANSLFRGINTNNITGEVLQRYGLGNGQGFNPSMTLGFSRSDVSTNFQTLGTGGVDRAGYLKLDGSNTIGLYNGIRVHAENASIRGNIMRVGAAECKSEVKSKIQNISLGVTTSGSVASVGAGVSSLHSKNTTYINSHLDIDKHTDVNLKVLTLNGGNITTSTISGHVDTATVNTLQNTSSTTLSSFNASTSGTVSAVTSHQESALVSEKASRHLCSRWY